MKCAKAAILIPLVICVIIGFTSLWEETKPHVLAAYTSATASDIIFWLLVGLTLSMTIGVFMLLHKHNRLLNDSKNHTHTLPEEVKGIGLYVRIIAYIAIIVCLFIALHYLCVQHARVLTPQGNGADYIGVIVGIMSAMITLLVGWNIYSTIKAKEELREAKSDIENLFSKRLDEFDKCCKKRGEQIKKLEDCCDKRKKEIRKLMIGTNKSLNTTLMIAENHFGDIYKTLILGEDELGYEYLFISYRIRAIWHIAKTGDYKGCSLIVADIMQTLNRIWPITMTEKSKKDLIDDLLEVDNPERIVGYEDLRKFLSKIPTDPNAKGL